MYLFLLASSVSLRYRRGKCFDFQKESNYLWTWHGGELCRPWHCRELVNFHFYKMRGAILLFPPLLYGVNKYTLLKIKFLVQGKPSGQKTSTTTWNIRSPATLQWNLMEHRVADNCEQTEKGGRLQRVQKSFDQKLQCRSLTVSDCRTLFQSSFSF